MGVEMPLPEEEEVVEAEPSLLIALHAEMPTIARASTAAMPIAMMGAFFIGARVAREGAALLAAWLAAAALKSSGRGGAPALRAGRGTAAGMGWVSTAGMGWVSGTGVGSGAGTGSGAGAGAGSGWVSTAGAGSGAGAGAGSGSGRNPGAGSSMSLGAETELSGLGASAELGVTGAPQLAHVS